MKFRLIIALSLIIVFKSYAQSEKDKEIENLIKLETTKFDFILRTAYKNYVDSIDIKTIAEAGINATLKELDPFSQYLNTEQNKRILESDAGESVGIGADLLAFGDTLTVYSLSENSPAEKAGLKRGDKVLFINGKSCIKMLAKDANDLLKGAKNTSAALIIKRGFGAFLQEVNIKRDEFPVSSIICSYMLNKETGYIFLNKFTAKSHADFVEAIKKLQSQGLKNLILDLRNNPGGYVKEAVDLADEFLPKGFEIVNVKTRNKDFAEHYTSTAEKKLCENLGLVVILNENSASASEIFAGTMQDLDRGVIVGTLSYGKAYVQKQWNFNEDASAFRLTIGRYFTPSGRCLQKVKNKTGLYEESKFNMGEDDMASQIAKFIEANGGNNQLPLFDSRKGKKLISIGGIFPNIIAKQDTTTLLTKNLKSRNYFLEFAYKICQEKNDSLKGLGQNFIDFNNKFKIDDSLLVQFKNFSVAKGIWNEKMFLTDKELIRNYLASFVSQYYFGDKYYYQIQLNYDKQFNTAIEQIDSAKELVRDFN